MKILFSFLHLGAFVIACTIAMFCNASIGMAETVRIYGEPLSQTGILKEALKPLNVIPVKDAELTNLNVNETRLLILAGEHALSSSSHLAVSRFLQDGGNLIVIGAHNFQAAPQPINEMSLGDFASEGAYQIIKPGKGYGEDPRISHIKTPGGKAALRLTTSTRDMVNLHIQLSADVLHSPKRTVVTFEAKGDAYMDLLSLEATDTAGKKYFSFVPLSQDWATYSISLADFIPEGWKDAQKPYPLIDPAELKTISLGTNRNTLWQEKPMDFSLGQVSLSEEKNNVYAPTPALNRLTVPFKEIGITAPEWIFDPFYGSRKIAASSFHAPKDSKSTSNDPAEAWDLPPAYADFPGTKMGTDHKKEYNTLQSHSMRRQVLFETSDSNDPVAESRLFTGGIYAGSTVVLYGFTPQQVLNQKPLLNSLTTTINNILHQPQIAQVTINTTTQKADSSIVPLLDITLKNPLDHAISGTVTADVGSGILHGNATVNLPPQSLSKQTIQLNSVPKDFNFKQFHWKVSLSSAAGKDAWDDNVDVERTLLQAIIHMVKAQDIYPDGRISNTYFSDAYGVRAMYAYLRFLKEQPEHLLLNQDLWKQITPQQTLDSAEHFNDMLVRRQNADGSVPMGYGEQTNSFNVADGGQIALGLGCSAYEEADPVRRKQYLQACKKIIDFAETFYIDQKLFETLQKSEPELIKKYHTIPGYYGLGAYRDGKRISAGPIWVLSDILAPQALLAQAFPEGVYPQRLKRNVNLYLDRAGDVSGWYQSEAMMWCWFVLPDQRKRIADNLKSTFLPGLFSGDADEMYFSGSRGTLRALPLAYYREYISDSQNERAALLKYVWAAGSETSSTSVNSQAREYPNPHHGASLAAVRFSEFSSIWAMELLEPDSTLVKVKQLMRAKQ